MQNRNKILIVDDVEINRNILQELFPKENYDALTAINGLEALPIIEKNIDNLALILLDVVMPIMDGFATLSQMKEKGFLGKVPVIALTAGDVNHQDINIIDFGADDFVQKPFNPTIVKRRALNTIYAFNYKEEHNL